MHTYDLTICGERALIDDVTPDDKRIAEIVARDTPLTEVDVETRCVDRQGTMRIWELTVRANWDSDELSNVAQLGYEAETVLRNIGYRFTHSVVRPTTTPQLF